jgi:hypothetical protein
VRPVTKDKNAVDSEDIADGPTSDLQGMPNGDWGEVVKGMRTSRDNLRECDDVYVRHTFVTKSDVLTTLIQSIRLRGFPIYITKVICIYDVGCGQVGRRDEVERQCH